MENRGGGVGIGLGVGKLRGVEVELTMMVGLAKIRLEKIGILAHNDEFTNQPTNPSSKTPPPSPSFTHFRSPYPPPPPYPAP